MRNRYKTSPAKISKKDSNKISHMTLPEVFRQDDWVAQEPSQEEVAPLTPQEEEEILRLIEECITLANSEEDKPEFEWNSCGTFYANAC